MDEFVQNINDIKDGDYVSLTVPIGGQSVEVTGKAVVDTDGNVRVILDNPQRYNGGSVGSNIESIDIDRKGGKLASGDTVTIRANTDNFVVGSVDVSVNTKDGTSKTGENETKIPDGGLGVKKLEADQIPTTPAGDKQYYSKNDEYKNASGGLHDRENEFGATDDPSVHDQNMWHTHVTRVSGYAGEGEKVTLADNPRFDDIIKYNQENNLNFFKEKDKSNFSKYDFVMQYAQTGQYSVEDLLKAADAMESNDLVSFSKHDHDDYWPQAFQDMLDKTKDEDYGKLADQLKEDVEFLETEFAKVHDQMTEWAGESKGAVADAIQCILGKFECTMSNISGVVGPACKKIEEFKDNLEKLKQGKEELDVLDEELVTLTADYEAKQAEYEAKKAENLPATLSRTVQDKDEEGNVTGSHQESYDNPAYGPWQTECANKLAAAEEAKTKKEEKEIEIEEKEKVLDELLEEVLKTYFLIKNLTTTIKSFKEYFPGGSKNYMISSKDNIVKYHDTIVDDFEDFTKMPVITSLLGYYDQDGTFVDYQVGDIVIFDDAHGYAYKITDLDPLHLSVTIVAVDENGNEIGTPIVITDPREISTITYVEKLSEKVPALKEEYGTFFKGTTPPEELPTEGTTTPGSTGPQTTPKPKPPGGGTKTPPPGGGTKTPPPGTKTTPPPGTKTTPKPGTTPPPGTKTTPRPGTTPRPSSAPSTIAGPGTFGPFGGGVYSTGIYGYGGYSAPHTGLDEVYTAGDTSESAMGLGALAALAAGAIGLGATAYSDKKKEDEEEKKEAVGVNSSQEKHEEQQVKPETLD